MTQRAMTPRTVAALVLFALLPLAPSLVSAQTPPPADQIIERHVEAMGGRSLVLGVTSIESRGTMSIPAMGMQGEFTLSQKQPDRMRMHATLPGIGEITSGFDGEVGWSINPVTGAAIMEGAELVQTREQAGIAASIRDRSLVPERETVGQAEFGGESCWRVRITWVSGRTGHDCYSVETGLLIAAEEVQATAMGDVSATVRYSDYREFGGILFPTRISSAAMGIEQVMVIQDVQIGGVPDSTFELPPAIRTLLGGG